MGTKLLVIDDDPNICDLLKFYFENEGYEVKTANDGIEGLSYFKMYEGWSWPAPASRISSCLTSCFRKIRTATRFAER